MVKKQEHQAFGGETGAPYLKLMNELNNSFIFVSVAIPILNESEREFDWEEGTDLILFEVPTIDAPYGMAKRSEEELQNLFRFYLKNGLYEAFLISTISRFEVFLLDLLRIIFTHKPKAILHSEEETRQRGYEPPRLELRKILDFHTHEDLVRYLTDDKLKNLGNKGAISILEFFRKRFQITEVDAEKLAIFAEVKATRDILVHNENKINDQYLSKSGDKARGEIGDSLTVDNAYFISSISVMKRVATDLVKGVNRKFRQAPQR